MEIAFIFLNFFYFFCSLHRWRGTHKHHPILCDLGDHYLRFLGVRLLGRGNRELKIIHGIINDTFSVKKVSLLILFSLKSPINDTLEA